VRNELFVDGDLVPVIFVCYAASVVLREFDYFFLAAVSPPVGCDWDGTVVDYVVWTTLVLGFVRFSCLVRKRFEFFYHDGQKRASS